MVIRPISPVEMPTGLGEVTRASSTREGSFESILGQAVQNLTELQKTADVQAAGLATGQNVSLVDAVLAMEQTSLSFKLAMQVRDKVLEAYQDVMRTQL